MSSASVISTAGYAAWKRRQRPREPAGDRRHDAHRDAAAQQPGQLVDRGADARRAGERRACERQHRLAGGGERHGAAAAVEQRLAELGLQPPHLRADARLGDVLALGGAREAALLGHRDDVGELPEFHTD